MSVDEMEVQTVKYHIHVQITRADNCTVVMKENIPILRKYMLKYLEIKGPCCSLPFSGSKNIIAQ